MVIAIEATESRRQEIRNATLVHATSRSNFGSIVVDNQPTSRAIGETHTVHLEAAQGFSLGRLLRDYSVLDVNVTSDADWGRYLYFFLGEPGRWATFKNLSMRKSWSRVQTEAMVIRIDGRVFMDAIGDAPLFYRIDDGAVVLRGDYRGPAHVA